MTDAIEVLCKHLEILRLNSPGFRMTIVYSKKGSLHIMEFSHARKITNWVRGSSSSCLWWLHHHFVGLASSCTLEDDCQQMMFCRGIEILCGTRVLTFVQRKRSLEANWLTYCVWRSFSVNDNTIMSLVMQLPVFIVVPPEIHGTSSSEINGTFISVYVMRQPCMSLFSLQ